MVHESTTKVGSVIIALALLGMVGLSISPTAQAKETVEIGEDEQGGPCIKIYTDPPDATIDPRNCETPVTNTSLPMPTP